MSYIARAVRQAFVRIAENPETARSYGMDITRAVVVDRLGEPAAIAWDNLQAAKQAYYDAVEKTYCCNCGMVVDTREVEDGGSPDGCELSTGEWVCSSECYDEVVEEPYVSR